MRPRMHPQFFYPHFSNNHNNKQHKQHYLIFGCSCCVILLFKLFDKIGGGCPKKKSCSSCEILLLVLFEKT